MDIPSASSIHDMSTAQGLDNLARIVVQVGLGLVPGQQLIVTAPVDGAILARKVTRQAYLSGASLVTTIFTDEKSTLSRFRHARDESFDCAPNWLFSGMADAIRAGAARVSLTGDDPALLARQDSRKVARAKSAHSRAFRPVAELASKLSSNWSIAPCPTPAWARAVFPDEAQGAATAKLWHAVFAATRADRTNPVAAWHAHIAEQLARARLLDGKQYAALHFVGPGTDLTVGLAEGHVWAGGSATTAGGTTCVPNIPSEEIFTAPHRERVDGVVVTTKPLVLHGTVLRDVAFRFSDGQVNDVKARGGEDVIRKLLDADQGARRLGEIALVPHSSPIASSDTLFFNTLLDENAASHAALGQAYAKCLRNYDRMTPQDLAAAGANHSLVHVDFMFGSGAVDVDGVTSAGSCEPVMRGGEWVV